MPTWTTHDGQNSINGALQAGVSTLAACRAACLADQRCAGLDWKQAGPDYCWLHRQLNGPYHSPGVTQHILVDRCQTTSGMTSSSRDNAAALILALNVFVCSRSLNDVQSMLLSSRFIIIRPHRSTTYVHSAYCYRPSSVVCRSARQSVTLESPAKTAEPIDCGLGWGPRNHILDGVQIPMGRGNFGGKWRP